jgi:hypothetical protein
LGDGAERDLYATGPSIILPRAATKGTNDAARDRRARVVPSYIKGTLFPLLAKCF